MLDFVRRNAWRILWGAVREWHEDKVPRLAAALAFYTMFALTPIVLLALAIAKTFADRALALEGIQAQVRILVGDAGAQLAGELLAYNPRQSGDPVATLIGLAVLFYAALSAFTELKDALDTIWEVQPKAGLRIWPMLRAHFLSFAMVLVIGFFLLVSLVISASVDALRDDLRILVPTTMLHVLETGVSFVIIAGLFALMYKVLPDVTVAWRDVWFGAATSAVLFAVGKTLFGVYLGHSTIGVTYGAAGSLVIVVLWTYYSSLILLFGAEMTQVQSRLRGARREVSEKAVPLTDHDRIQQGIPREDQLAEAPPPRS